MEFFSKFFKPKPQSHWTTGDIKSSESFCPLPWVHLSTHTVGRPRICCDAEGSITNRKGQEVTLDSAQNLKAFMNSQSLKDVRLKMLKGEKPKECSKCHGYELSGGHSPRKDWIETWKDYNQEIVETTKADGSITKPLIKYIDLPLGNKCNLKCRMCGPESSNQLTEEFKKLGFNYDSDSVNKLEACDWTTSEALTKILDKALQETTMLYFTGGEPFLIDRHYQILEKAVSLGQASKISLRYNTNLTVLPKKIFELWDHFHEVSLSCSMEGCNELNDYIRYPSKWSTITKNLKRLDDYATTRENFKITIHSTFQALTVHGIPKFLDHIRSLGLKKCFAAPYYIILSHPQHLRADILPADIKHHISKKIVDHIEKHQDYYLNVECQDHREWNESRLKRLKSLAIEMKKTPATHKHDFECFKKVVDAQDKFRNQDISEVIPELSRYFLKKSEGERFSEQYSKTFCAYPWTHLMTNPKGMTFLCCRSEGATSEELSPTGEMGSLKKAFNSKRMKEIRKKMLAGEKVSDCERCYTEEAKGVRSLRMDANTQWLSKENRAQVREIIGKSITEDLHVDSPPLSLDWRPGNSCNLKCRMCGPENSSGIQKEWLELKEERPEFIKHLERYRPIPIGKISSWYENDNVWKELDSWLPSFKKIYITGGEPTLIEGNWSLLNKAAELGYAKDIELQISLNTTRLPAKLSRTLEHFKHTSLNLSIDGMGPTLEYIRFPSTWQKTKENLLEVMDWRLNNLDTWLTPVVQVYNVLTLPDFIEWFLDIKVKTNSPTNICLLPNEGQPLLDISILPQVTRNHAIARWNKLAKHPGFYTCGPILRERVDLILHILETSFQNTAQEKLKDFWHFTKILDAKRGQSFEKTFPDLYEQLRPEIFRDSTKPSLETQAHL